ncbi:MAG: riboflavin synthase [Planctomycetia bacterium]|nr:riboflavin synthase [Planctomycetia bacterium]
MFTGLVEAVAPVVSVVPEGAGARLVIEQAAIAGSLKVGDSVAVNGACLTVVALDGSRFHFEAGPETLRLTNLGELRQGDRVNLERSLALGDRLDGHLVQGHIDGRGTIDAKERQGEWVFMAFRCSPLLTAQMVSKGSIAVDGISLTVVNVERDRFSVMLIPHTLANTTLGFKEPGAAVNLETDMLAKYVFKALEAFQSRLTT